MFQSQKILISPAFLSWICI